MIDSVGKLCVGCGSCASACPQRCIEMRQNEEGFLYPQLDKERCVSCNCCEKVCPVMFHGKLYDINNARIYGAKAKKEYEGEILKSASAGVFYFLAKHIIDNGGYIFGAVFDENHAVRHICGKSLDDIARMQNSKYVQSDMTAVFDCIKTILKSNNKAPILFCGTPCQCLGLKSFLGKDYDNLFLVDIVCHGVPSPLAFRKYLKYLERTKREKLEDYQFRYKYKGWNYHGYMSSYVKFNNHYWPTVIDPYMSSFLKMNDYRESCYTCQYNTQRKASDISLADFSGVREIASEFFSKAGCSEIFVHTAKGNYLLDCISRYMDYIPLDTNQLTGYNTILKKQRVRPKIRDLIYQDINRIDDIEFVENRLRKSVTKKGILGFYIPYSARKLLSKLTVKKNAM